MLALLLAKRQIQLWRMREDLQPLATAVTDFEWSQRNTGFQVTNVMTGANVPALQTQ
jgi:hypothetical protein